MNTLYAISIASLVAPGVLFAQVNNIGDLEGLIASLLGDLGYLFFAMATAFFMWGVVKFIMNADDSSEREKGKQFIIWGIIALVVLVSLWGIVTIVLDTLGVVPGGPPAFITD